MNSIRKKKYTDRLRPREIALRIAVLLIRSEAWSITPEGHILSYDGLQLDRLYRRRSVIYVDLGDGNGILLHTARIVYAAMHKGYIPRGLEVDHIDECCWNDRPDNLQLLTKMENLEKNIQHRLPQDDKDAIQTAKMLRERGFDHFMIAETVGRSCSWVSRITRRADDRAVGAPVLRKNNAGRRQLC